MLRGGGNLLHHFCRTCARRTLSPSHLSNILSQRRKQSTSAFDGEPDSTTANFVAIKMPSSRRRLVRVSGIDSFIYLQSLLTNDMRQLLPVDRLQADFRNRSNHSMSQLAAVDQPLLYAYLLSAVGRVLADLFVYRGRYRAEDGEYIVEVSQLNFILIKI